MKKHTAFFRFHFIPLVYDLAGSALYAMGLSTFAKNGGFASGGVSGLSLLAYHLWRMPIGFTTVLINLPLVLLSYRVVGRTFILKTVRSVLICTVFLDVLFPMLPAYHGEPLLAALFGGAGIGAGMALFYRHGSSSGGTDFLTMTVKTLWPYFSLGTVSMAIDFMIILLGWPVFGHADAVLYGLVMTFVCAFTLDKLMYGTGGGKLVFVITAYGHVVAEQMMQISGRGATMIRAIGSYTNETRYIVLCACARAQAYMVKEAAHAVDPHAFVLFTEVAEVFGKGFTEKTH